MASAQKIRVLVVDDSAYVRMVVSRLLSSRADIEVVGQAADGVEALELARKLQPEVITLDVEMPRLNGLQVLERLLPTQPIPVVMLSSLTQRGAEVTLEALRLGAVDFVRKPGSAGVPDLEAVRFQLLSKVRAAARARVRAGKPPVRAPRSAPSPLSPSSPRQPKSAAQAGAPEVVVLVAASTGGPSTLAWLFSALPADLPAAFAVTQHMPPTFTAALARRLEECSPLQVREAREGDFLQAGGALVAPGGYHLLLGPQGVAYLSTAPPVWGVRPAADPMMKSAAENLSRPLIGVVLTGMGQDGAAGIVAIKEAGGLTVVEAEESAIIYGMPKAARETGCCDLVLPLGEMPDRLSGAIAQAAARERGRRRVAGGGVK